MEQGREKMLLADIGNTTFHIFDGRSVAHLSYDDAIAKYKDQALYYVSVKHQLEEKIAKIGQWKNISHMLLLKGAYETMGVDRKALCLSHQNGVFVDAGSAITVDSVRNGIYQGGFILPGIKAYLKSFAEISPALSSDLNASVDLTELPLTTKDGISYGIIASIKALIEKHHTGQTLYFTGGDGALLSRFFKGAVFDETLVFKGMQKAIKEDKIC